MLEINPNYSTTTSVNLAKSNILSVVPIGQKNKMHGLLMVFQNSIIRELENQRKSMNT